MAIPGPEAAPGGIGSAVEVLDLSGGVCRALPCPAETNERFCSNQVAELDKLFLADEIGFQVTPPRRKGDALVPRTNRSIPFIALDCGSSKADHSGIHCLQSRHHVRPPDSQHGIFTDQI